MPRLSRRTVLEVCSSVLALLVAGASCSLDLDETRIEGASDAGDALADVGLRDSPSEDDGGGDGSAPVVPEPGSCTSDDACATDHGCLKGKCDRTRNRCVYDVCRPSACNAAACEPTARTCGAAAPYTLKAAQFNVGAQIACPKCAAAVHPWLFVVTSMGVVAFNVSNPANPTPPQVPVIGLGFVPRALAQSGSRVWMLGGAAGGGPSRIQLAYADVPADPFATTIVAHTVFAYYNRPAEGTWLLPRGGDSALLVSQAESFPSVALEAPLNEPASLTATPLLPPQNFGPSAVSGKRLLLSAVVEQAALFAFVDDAGSTNPTTGAVVNLGDAGAVSVHRTFAQSPDGAIFWATGVHHGEPVTTRAARGYFLVSDANGPMDGNAGVDVEVYDADPVEANAPIFGGMQAAAAMLDAKTVMIATQARENNQQTAVHFVQREPLGLVNDGGVPRRLVLPSPIGSFAAAVASNGMGYLVANDQVGEAPSATVYVFDPACTP